MGFTDKAISEIEKCLYFHSDPMFTKSEIECVLFSFRAFGDDIQKIKDWLSIRKPLFDHPEIVPLAISFLDGK